MHALDVPVVAEHALPEDTDIITFMRDWCAQVVARMEAAGIARERLIVDPGPGFGKTAKQSWQLVSDLAGWRPEGVPVLIGHSRKRFLNLFDAQADAASRDALTRSVSAMLAAQGADIIRVHDVEGHRALFEALR
jgi:dihydropteroate synthase